jgi:hypothetical protein
VPTPSTEETSVADEDDEKSKEKRKSKDDEESKDKDNSSKDDAESSEDESTGAAAPPWGIKVLRVFLFASLGTFFTALLFGDPIPTGLRVHFDFLASIKLGLVAGLLAAILRALAAMLPVFVDDTAGRRRES